MEKYLDDLISSTIVLMTFSDTILMNCSQVENDKEEVLPLPGLLYLDM